MLGLHDREKKYCFYCTKILESNENINSNIHTTCIPLYEKDLLDEQFAIKDLERFTPFPISLFNFKDFSEDGDHPCSYVVLNQESGLVEKISLCGDLHIDEDDDEDDEHDADDRVDHRYNLMFKMFPFFRHLHTLVLEFFGQLGPFPIEFSTIKNLSSLTIGDSYFSENSLPFICSLKFLTLMDVKDPESILSHLGNLISLRLDDDNLKYFPKAVCNLHSLVFLSIHTDCTSIPEEIGQLTKLKKLSLEFNKISKLPDSIGNLSNLKLIDLDKNLLTDISILERLSNLRYITVSGFYTDNKMDPYNRYLPINQRNYISKLPEFKNLPFLRILRLNLSIDCNELDKIGRCTQLTYLNLASEVKSFPESFKNLVNLKILVYKSNSNVVPSFISFLPNLFEFFVLSDFRAPEAIPINQVNIQIDYDLGDDEDPDFYDEI